MNPPLPFSCSRALVASVLGLVTLPLAAFSQDITPPVVNVPLSDLTVPVGTTVSVVKLKKTFALTGVTGPIVRMATSVNDANGNPLDIDVEVFADAAPANAANFLSYVNSGEYNKTFIHRLASGFVLQGGGYYVSENSSGNYTPQHLPSPAATVPGEHSISNTRGTLTFALSNGPDTANSEWFFNLINNDGSVPNSPNLDNATDGGPFTVFARVIEGGLSAMDQLANLPIYDLNTSFGYADTSSSPFGTVPLNVAKGTANLDIGDLLYLNDVVVIPLISSTTDASDSAIKVKAKNSNHDLLTATVTGKKLKLAYNAGKTGTAHIKVIAIDSAGTRAVSKFTVTVQ